MSHNITSVGVSSVFSDTDFGSINIHSEISVCVSLIEGDGNECKYQ